VALAEPFLQLLSNASLPSFNATLNFSMAFADTVRGLVALAQAYPGQTLDTVVTLKRATLFCNSINATYLATLAGVYRDYQQAADPQLQARIKAGFEASQQRWITAAKGETSAVLAALAPWQLSGPGLDAYNGLKAFIGNCQQGLPDYIAALKRLIAQLTQTCGHPCPALDKAERDLAEAEAELAYCDQGAQTYAVELAVAINRMTGSLWGLVLGLMHAVADDLGLSIGSLAQLDLDNVIFELTLEEAVRAWTDAEGEAYSVYYYACANGLIPQ
jgi:hypothetical protein